jgi:hypothetical protein
MPASLLEKYLFEVVLKIVLFALLYPLIFKLIGEMTVVFADFTFPRENHYDFTYAGLIKFSQEDFFPFISWLYVFGAFIAFAGATAFRRLPLIKTLVFLGIVIGSIVGYFYLLIVKIHLGNAIGYFIENSWIKEEKEAMTFGILLLVISSLTALAYAFFNVKEREV